MLEAIYKTGGVFNYPKAFQCDNISEFKNQVTFKEQQRNISIHIQPLWKAFNKGLAKLLFKWMDAQELQDPEKVSTIWVKNLNKIVDKINNRVSSMIGMKPKDTIKLDTVPLGKTYPEETVLPEDGSYRYFYQPGEKHGDQKRRATDLIWSKNTYRLN